MRSRVRQIMILPAIIETSCLRSKRRSLRWVKYLQKVISRWPRYASLFLLYFKYWNDIATTKYRTTRGRTQLPSDKSKETRGPKAFEHQDIAAEEFKKMSSHVRKIMMLSAITETLSLRSNRSSAMIFTKFERDSRSQGFLNVTTSHRKNGNMDITFL